MKKSEFVKRYKQVVNETADVFDTPEHYQKIIDAYASKDNNSSSTTEKQIKVATMIARNYAENLTYNLLKEFLVDESD